MSVFKNENKCVEDCGEKSHVVGLDSGSEKATGVRTKDVDILFESDGDGKKQE